MKKVVVTIVGAIVGIVEIVVAGVMLLNHLPISSQPNIPYNTFYLLNYTYLPHSTIPFASCYIFVVSYKEYSQIVGNATNSTNLIVTAFINNTDPITMTKVIIEGNYVFLMGTTLYLNVSVGEKYPITFYEYEHGIYGPLEPYKIWLTYEGNWTGPLP
jgi:hypothetical protein